MKLKRILLSFIFILSVVTFGLSLYLGETFYKLNDVEVVKIKFELPEKITTVIKDDIKDEKAQENEKKNYISVKNSEIYKNKNYQGTLSISNTNFKEPLYQYSDNDYYLTHDGLGRKKSSGATYLDYRVSNTSDKILIYGHNNDSLSLPFSILENYNDYDYYQEHKYLTLEYGSKKYKYEIFSVYIETGNWDYMKVNFTSQSSWLKHLNNLKSRSFYDTGVEVSSADKILILQTCSKNKKYSSYKKKYMLVIAKMIKE